MSVSARLMSGARFRAMGMKSTFHGFSFLGASNGRSAPALASLAAFCAFLPFLISGCASSGGGGARVSKTEDKARGVRVFTRSSSSARGKKPEVKYLEPPPKCRAPIVRKEQFKVIVIGDRGLRERYGAPGKRRGESEGTGSGTEDGARP